MKYVPYTYIITFKETGEFYYGSKYGVDANPEYFWIRYFTSSKTIHKLIELYGKDSFEVEVLQTFKTSEETQLNEQRLIRDSIYKKLSLNGAIGGVCVNPNKGRMIKDANGLTSYDKCQEKIYDTKHNIILDNGLTIQENATKKAIETALNNIDENGLNSYQRCAKRLKNDRNKINPKTNKRIYDEIGQKAKETALNNIDENGLNSYQRGALKQQESALNNIDENGLNSNQRGGLNRMGEKNGAYNTFYYNNGKTNKRIKDGEVIPEGFVKGMLPEKTYPCKYCGKKMKKSNLSRWHNENCKSKGNL